MSIAGTIFRIGPSKRCAVEYALRLGCRFSYTPALRIITREARVFFWKTLLVIGLAAGLALGQEPSWVDRGEYELVVEQIGKATDPAKKLELLNQWKTKYPKTAFAMQRLGQFLGTYQQLGKAAEMLGVAREIAAADTKNFTGPYYIALLTTSMQTTDPATLAEGEKAANLLLSNIGEYFAEAKKPAGVDAAAWNKQKADVQNTAWATLLYVSNASKNPATIEATLRKFIDFNPANAEAAYKLGAAILGQKKAERQPEALWQVARACALTGAGELPAANKKAVCDYLNRVYPQYRGDKKGLDKLMADAAATTYAPAGFAIQTKQQEDIAQLEDLKRTNPQLALWVQLKQELTGPTAAANFEMNLKGAAIPKLKGKLVSMEPALNPKKLVIGVSDATTPEITIILEENAAFKGKAEPGIEIEFEGIGKDFSVDPFNLTVEAERAQIIGWPTPGVAGAAPAAKKGGGAKKAAPKKK